MDRRYLPPANGGLGIFNLKIFLDAQRCSWIKRAVTKNIDNWRYDLKCLSPAGDITLIRKIDVDSFANPILTNIVRSYQTFLPAFTLMEKNYKKGKFSLTRPSSDPVPTMAYWIFLFLLRLSTIGPKIPFDRSLLKNASLMAPSEPRLNFWT
jgi:hypothetical protein